MYVWASSSKKSHYIGAFPTPLEAARAYDVAMLWLMGQQVRPRTRLNFDITDYKLEDIQAEASAVVAMARLSRSATSGPPPLPLPPPSEVAAGPPAVAAAATASPVSDLLSQAAAQLGLLLDVRIPGAEK